MEKVPYRAKLDAPLSANDKSWHQFEYPRNHLASSNIHLKSHLTSQIILPAQRRACTLNTSSPWSPGNCKLTVPVASSSLTPSTSINTLALPALFYIGPKALSLYRSLRSPAYKQSIRPVPPQLIPVLTLLLSTTTLLLLVLLLPHFQPTNIFTLTAARPSTPTNQLFDRLSTFRPLTAQEDGPLRAALARKEGRLLYFALGPDTLADCTFCSPVELDDPNAATVPLSYLIFQLPGQMAGHVLNMLVLGLVTSRVFVDNFASLIYGIIGTRIEATTGTVTKTARWRIPFLTLSLALAAADLYLLSTYDIRSNASPAALRSLDSVDFLHWRLRTYRLLSLASLNIALSACIYLAATQRFFVQPPGLPERLSAMAQVMEMGSVKLWATGVIKNSVVRNGELKRKEAEYWEEEGKVWEEREVVSAMQAVLKRWGRVQLAALEKAAEERAEGVVGMLGGPTT